MSLAIICGYDANTLESEPLNIIDLNIEDSFFTDAPSVRAAFGFAMSLSELGGLKYSKKGMVVKGIKIKGVSCIIHDFKRDVGTVGFVSGTQNYITEKDTSSPPRPLEVKSAKAKVSLIIDYDGKLPDLESLDSLLNGKTARFNGGVILNNLQIKPIDDDALLTYISMHNGWQIVDRADLNITEIDIMARHVSTFVDPFTGEKVRPFDGVFYIHQTGYQLLEEPVFRKGTLLFGEKECKHAFCEPILNIAEIKHSKWINSCDDLCFWKRVSNKNNRTTVLTAVEL